MSRWPGPPALRPRALRHRAVRLRWQLLDHLGRVNRRTTDSRAVALTFDDGPHYGSTDQILDILAELDVTATFFCVGRNALAHPELLRRMRAEGHSVGSHSFTHPDPAETSARALVKDYVRGRRAVAEALGQDTKLFRPPHGHLDTASALVFRGLGLSPWLWSVDPEDWRPGAVREHIRDVAGRAGPADVVLMHDWIEQPWAPEALDRSATVGALRDVVADVRHRGLTFTTLPA